MGEIALSKLIEPFMQPMPWITVCKNACTDNCVCIEAATRLLFVQFRANNHPEGNPENSLESAKEDHGNSSVGSRRANNIRLLLDQAPVYVGQHSMS